MGGAGSTVTRDEAKETLRGLICDGLQFDQPPDELLLCCNCGLVPIFHNIFPCGHPYCRDCSQVFVQQKRGCRKCKTQAGTQTIESADLEAKISKLQTICPNKTLGCSNVDDLQNLLVHLEKCKFSHEDNARNEHSGDEINTEMLFGEICVVKSSVVKMQNEMREIEKRTNDKIDQLDSKLDAVILRLDAFDNDKKLIVDILKAIEVNITQFLGEALQKNNVTKPVENLQSPHTQPIISQSTNPQSSRQQTHRQHKLAQEQLVSSQFQDPDYEQRCELGQRLFPLVQRMYPDLAAEITDKLLINDVNALLKMIERPEALNIQIEILAAAFRNRKAKQLAKLPYDEPELLNYHLPQTKFLGRGFRGRAPNWRKAPGQNSELDPRGSNHSSAFDSRGSSHSSASGPRGSSHAPMIQPDNVWRKSGPTTIRNRRTITTYPEQDDDATSTKSS